MTAIVFDLDGTLIDSVGDIHAALNQMLAQAGRAPLDVGTVTSFVGKGSSNLVKRVIDHVGLPNDADSHADCLSKFSRPVSTRLREELLNSIKKSSNWQWRMEC